MISSVPIITTSQLRNLATEAADSRRSDPSLPPQRRLALAHCDPGIMINDGLSWLIMVHDVLVGGLVWDNDG